MATSPSLTCEQLREIPSPVPPAEEEKKAAERMEEEMERRLAAMEEELKTVKSQLTVAKAYTGEPWKWSRAALRRLRS